MDVVSFLSEVTAMPGLPNREGPVAERLAREFKKYSDRVSIDALGNVLAVVGNSGPTVLLCAHMDEIGLIATGLDKRGGVRFAGFGGVDPRVLPGCEVTIHGKEDVFGVIGVKPPHLTIGAQKAPAMKDLAIDTGLSKARAEELIPVGSPVSFHTPLVRLAGGRIACKTMDDRACVASLLVAAELLQNVKLRCRAVFCATVAEEVGCRGAKVAGYSVDPDMAIALDVTHGPCPGVPKDEIIQLDKVAIVRGPLLHPALFDRLTGIAKANGIAYEDEIAPGMTRTDADNLQIARNGIPTALLSVPLSYMHTTVETIQTRTVEETGRLLALFLQGLDEKWGDWLCCND